MRSTSKYSPRTSEKLESLVFSGSTTALVKPQDESYNKHIQMYGQTRDSNPSGPLNNLNTHVTNGIALTYTNTDDNVTINGRDSNINVGIMPQSIH